MSPTAIKILGVAVAVAAIVGSSFVGPAERDYLLAAATGVLGWVGLRRPGDSANAPHADDLP